MALQQGDVKGPSQRGCSADGGGATVHVHPTLSSQCFREVAAPPALALSVFWSAVKAVEATFKLRGRFKQEETARHSAAIVPFIVTYFVASFAYGDVFPAAMP